MSHPPGISPSASSSKPSPPQIPSSRPPLSLQQKTALIGGALILVLVLGTLLGPALGGLLPSPPGPADPSLQFKAALINNSRSAVLMDLRGAPTAPARQAILQCGVDFVSSGLYQQLHKDLTVYSCDETGCLSSRYRYDLGNGSASTTNVTVPYSDVLSRLAGSAYFHLQYAPQAQAPDYTAQYANVYINENTNESCAINVSAQ